MLMSLVKLLWSFLLCAKQCRLPQLCLLWGVGDVLKLLIQEKVQTEEQGDDKGVEYKRDRTGFLTFLSY